MYLQSEHGGEQGEEESCEERRSFEKDQTAEHRRYQGDELKLVRQ